MPSVNRPTDSPARKPIKAVSSFVCVPWCVDGDGHPDAILRADQCCQGSMRRVDLGLEPAALPLPIKPDGVDDGPKLTTYGRCNWHALPYVVLNVYLPNHNEHLHLDRDISLTAEEAYVVATALIAAATEVRDE